MPTSDRVAVVLPRIGGNRELIVEPGAAWSKGLLYCRTRLPPMPLGMFVASVLAPPISVLMLAMVTPELVTG